MLNKISFKEKPNLSQSCGLFVAAFVLITGVVLSLLSWSNLNKRLQADHLQNAQQQLSRLTIAIAPSLLLQDRISLNVSLQEWTKASDIHFIRVLNTNHQAIAEAGQQQAHSTELSRSITQDNLAIGTIKAEMNFDAINAIVARHLALGLTLTAIFTLLSGLISYLVCEHYFSYLRRFILQFRVWQADPKRPLVLPAPPQLPELNDLHQAVEQLTTHTQQENDLAEATQLFDLQQPLTIAELKYQPAAFIVINIANLAELKERLSPAVLTQLLQRYHSLFVQANKLYGGRLERYQGNGLVALFPGKSNDEQAALHSFYAAQLMLGLIEQQRLEPNACFVDFRLAGHWGDVLAPAEVPTGSHYTHDVLGDSLHWASCLTTETAALRLRISQALYHFTHHDQPVSWLAADSTTDFNGNPEPTWYLDALEEKQQALIQRQIRHITTLS